MYIYYMYIYYVYLIFLDLVKDIKDDEKLNVTKNKYSYTYVLSIIKIKIVSYCQLYFYQYDIIHR